MKQLVPPPLPPVPPVCPLLGLHQRSWIIFTLEQVHLCFLTARVMLLHCFY